MDESVPAKYRYKICACFDIIRQIIEGERRRGCADRQSTVLNFVLVDVAKSSIQVFEMYEMNREWVILIESQACILLSRFRVSENKNKLDLSRMTPIGRYLWYQVLHRVLLTT